MKTIKYILLQVILLVFLINEGYSQTNFWENNHDDIYNTNLGNIGIGNKSPKYKLDISGDLNAEDIKRNGVSLKESQWNEIPSFNQIQYMGGIVLGSYTTSYPLSFNKLIVGGTIGFGFNPSSLYALRLNTGDPADLTLSYGIEQADGMSFNGLGIRIKDNVANKGFYIRDAATNTYRMVVANNGNVGIGTTNPQFGNLQINNSAVPLAFKETDQTGAGSLWRMPLDAKNLRFDVSQNGTDFSTYITPLLLTPAGNVGIGTFTPTQKLDVIGNVKVSDYVMSKKFQTTQLNDFGFVPAGDGWTGFDLTGSSVNKRIIIGVDGNRTSNVFDIERTDTWEHLLELRANGSGYFKKNITIGTLTPYINNGYESALSVNGTITSKEVYVKASGWPDFVFDKNHKLISLDELEKSISENGHLPEIPTEKEVMDNGIEVGDISAKLLQKIEELTLYVIDQNNKINKIENDNKKLKNEISSLKNNSK
jgi:hypothetical protein